MTARDKTTLKTYFNTGDVPTATNFADTLDSFAPDVSLLSSGTAAQATDNFPAMRGASYVYLNPDLLNTYVTVKTQAAEGNNVTVGEITPFDSPTHAPWNISASCTYYNPNHVVDPIISIGYNARANLSYIQAGEPLFVWRIEGDWQSAPGTHILESYWSYGNAATDFAIRPIHVTIDRGTGEVLPYIRSSGVGGISFQDAANPGTNSYTTYCNFQTTVTDFGGFTANEYVVRINGGTVGSNKSGILQLGYNGVNNVAILKASGAHTVQLNINGNNAVQFVDLIAGNAVPGFFIGPNAAADAHIVVTPTHSALAGLQVIAKSDQAASLFLIKVGSAYPFRVTKSGYALVGATSAPADAEVLTSTALFWFDNTDGAGKLMIKAKTANGTVVTGSVALT